MIYLDNNATTVIAPEVFAAMTPYLTNEFGNPSSAHHAGRKSSFAVARARSAVAEFLGARSADEITFTGSGTEADNWAILGTLENRPDNRHLITTRVEHEAVRKIYTALEQRGYRVTWLDVDSDGAIDLGQLDDALSADTAIVSVMMANNETGILFPISEIAALVRKRSDAYLHVDAVNAAGKVPIDASGMDIDLMAISAHKFHGPKGIGALYIRDGVEIEPMLIGGGQERGLRAGTEPVHQIVGIGEAARTALNSMPNTNVQELRDQLEAKILATIPNAYLNGTADISLRLPNTSSISFEDTNGEMIMSRLDDEGVCVSTGSACHSQDHRGSAVLGAMDIPYSRVMGSIRFSLGRYNTADDVRHVCEILPAIVSDLRQRL